MNRNPSGQRVGGAPAAQNRNYAKLGRPDLGAGVASKANPINKPSPVKKPSQPLKPSPVKNPSKMNNMGGPHGRGVPFGAAFSAPGAPADPFAKITGQ